LQLADLGAGVEARSVLSEHYQELADFLSRTHEVVPCAYDWRQATAASAESLAGMIAGLLKQPTRTVRIVARRGRARRERMLADAGPGRAHANGVASCCSAPHAAL
jgi:hypothetical protein